MDVERPDSPASPAAEAEVFEAAAFEVDPARRSTPPTRRARSAGARVPAPAAADRDVDPDGFDLRGWLRGPRHREAPGVYGYGRDEREIKLRAAEREARTRPEAALVRRAVLWLVIAVLSLNWVIMAYVWLVRKIIPTFLWPLLFNNLLYVLVFVLFGYLGRWHEIARPFLRPWWQRLDRRAELNGRPRPEQWRRAALFLVLGFVAWIVLMRPFVALLLLIFPRGLLHDGQWLVRLLYNGGFLYAAAVLGRWNVVVGPYARTPATHAAHPDEEAPVADAELWPELRDAGQHEAADVLDHEVAAGRLRDVDYLRLRRVIGAASSTPNTSPTWPTRSTTTAPRPVGTAPGSATCAPGGPNTTCWPDRYGSAWAPTTRGTRRCTGTPRSRWTWTCSAPRCSWSARPEPASRVGCWSRSWRR